MQLGTSLLLLLTTTLFLINNHVLAYKTIIDVLSEDSRFEKLIEHLQRTRLVPHVNSLEAGTLFAPDNDAFERFKGDEITQGMLLYHLLPVGMIGEDFFHGQLLESLYIRPGFLGSDDAGQRIKITKDGKPGKGRGKPYINGAEIIDKDIVVNNQTYVQVINQVLVPPPTLSDSIQSNVELYGFLQKVGLDDKLKQPRPFTVFLSRQSVLNRLNPVEKDYIVSQYGIDDLDRLLKYMVVGDVVYSAEFPSGKTVYKTLSGESLVVGVNKDNVITVNDVPVTETDVLAANGVVHILDDMPIPDNVVFNTRKYLYGLNSTKLVSLMDDYGLKHYLEDDVEKYTILAPGNDDIKEDSIPDSIKKDWLSYHVIGGSLTPDLLIDGSLLKSQFMSSRLGGAPQRIPVFVENEAPVKSAGKSIRFEHSRVLADPAVVKDNYIYQVSEPLQLPGDILSKLVIDLNLSTFIATIYVSEVADDIKGADGITMFVPTNEAFHDLGLVAQYLMHPAGKSHLQSVLRNHVAQGLLYREDMVQDAHEMTTLANATIRIGPSEGDSSKLVVSAPETGSKQAVVGHTDILVGNGVVHKIDGVQIPGYVEITTRDILVGIEANSMLEVLERAGLLDELNSTNYIVLTPSDRAFAHMDLDQLLKDPYELERLAKMHLIPIGWQDTWITSKHDNEYPTSLSEYDKVIFREEDNGGLMVLVKDRSDKTPAHVIGMGRTVGGKVDGGVLMMDGVLIPIRRGFFGLPWGWSIFLVTVISLISASIVGGCGFIIYKVWTRRRLGYRSID
ncbi:FAS1 domain-containing protein [Zychaea mexicana]|uniref:FAS1 domain-containing protein n=1 Tax=Zychaea mexicana TaxID=64656 RepID=UPI0022FE1AAA|nr:FAS1 domain-containing protein [Zychaea mexicana]KAI9490421.1 FAS1 domain-containing protein [Zychaea mexicana]